MKVALKCRVTLGCVGQKRKERCTTKEATQHPEMLDSNSKSGRFSARTSNWRLLTKLV